MKKAASFIVLCMLVLGCFSITASAQTEKVQIDTSKYVLQNGGLLEQNENAGIMLLSDADYAGAEKAIVKAMAYMKDSVDILAYNIPVSEADSFFNGILNRTPKLFYYESAEYSQNGGCINTIYFTYVGTRDECQEMMNDYNAAVTRILNKVEASWSDLEKVLYIHDYLTTNCAYTYGYHSAYDVLVRKEAVCQGYALAFMELMDQLQIPCEMVTSDSINHAWNIVKLNGKWYHLDATWDDPYPYDMLGRSLHDHFLKSYAVFTTTHCDENSSVIDYVYTGDQTNASTNNTDYDNAFWNDIDAAFNYYNGYWYAITSTDIMKYHCSDGVFITNGSIQSLSAKWFQWGSSSSYWTANYAHMTIFEGKLYYSQPSYIYYMDLSQGSTQSVEKHSIVGTTEGQLGYIYGMHVTPSGVLEYQVTTSPDYGEVGDFVATTGSISVHTHTPSGPATCTTANECLTCWEILEKAKGHTKGAAATCTTSQICTTCKEVLVQAPGHMKSAAATCTTSQICYVCNTVLVNAYGHRNLYNQVISTANFVTPQMIATYCSDCKQHISTNAGATLACVKNSVHTVGNYQYKILSNKTDGTGTVAVTGLVKNVKKVVIGSTVTIQGAKFKITQIANRAFKNNKAATSIQLGANIQKIGQEAFSGMTKVKTITVKSSKLSSVGKKALKNIHKKAKIKVPKKKLAKYKKLFKNKGQKSSVKVVKY